MLVIRNTPKKVLLPSVATIGFFDGVHRGHKFLIEQVRREAEKEGLCAAVVSFPISPKKVMNHKSLSKELSSFEEKCSLLEACGLDYCFMLDFTAELACLSAYDFMRVILRDRFGVKTLVIGYDHRFGHNRAEGFDDYKC